MKPLIYFKLDEKFTYNNTIYTVSQIDRDNNMVELFRKGEFTLWPLYNGKELIKVQPFVA